MNAHRVLAFDFGASSGRAMLAEYQNGRLTLNEVHRFSNDPVSVRGTLYWDVLRLYHEIKQGISKALLHGKFDAVGIDTWGVDFGLIGKDGTLIQNPVHYRDHRTYDIPDTVFQRISQRELYQATGIQHIHFNTLYQLAYLQKHKPELLLHTEKMLMIPDLFAYFLTGQMRGEVTNASTSNLWNAESQEWDSDICKRLGIPPDILPEPIQPGERYGTLSEEICSELDCPPVPVIAAATHDTASAVAGVPAQDDFVYISCGTWSLFGIESPKPILTPAAEQFNFTNEAGYGKTIRFLKNIMGLWLIQEARRHWLRKGEEVTYAMLEQDALKEQPFQCLIDCDAQEFESPGNLPGKVRAFCARTGQTVPQTRGQIMRCIYESLAMKYKYTFECLQTITGRQYPKIHLVGGGIKDTLLCRMTADASGVPVIAGPAESSSFGNASVQMIALGVFADIREARSVIANSVPLTAHEPSDTASWEQAYPAYLKILEKSKTERLEGHEK